ncbi:MAG TPA: hypothetical protein VFF27_10335 [Bacteroidia bacterium]|jgi:hypothetical protein|nr:hypothetical protein [Bacteroidia bacterium]
MRDFTLSSLELLLTTLLKNGYTFVTFEDYLRNKPEGKRVILRHDVDLFAHNSLETAILENKLGIKGTYFFRIVKQSNKPQIIKAIAALGHEIGYHYEDLAHAHGDKEKAIKSFEKNLEYFRTYYPVKTICMHGSPVSKWDNRKLWETYDYKEYGLIGEPYFELDFKKLLYLTDTGRMWDGHKVSVRDKMPHSSSHNLSFTTTFDIVKKGDQLPDQIMITTHPQRWNNDRFRWILELVFQNIKNLVKRWIA